MIRINYFLKIDSKLKPRKKEIDFLTRKRKTLPIVPEMYEH